MPTHSKEYFGILVKTYIIPKIKDKNAKKI